MKVYFNNQVQCLFLENVNSNMVGEITRTASPEDGTLSNSFIINLRSSYDTQINYEIEIQDDDQAVLKIEHGRSSFAIKHRIAEEYRS